MNNTAVTKTISKKRGRPAKQKPETVVNKGLDIELPKPSKLGEYVPDFAERQDEYLNMVDVYEEVKIAISEDLDAECMFKFDIKEREFYDKKHNEIMEYVVSKTLKNKAKSELLFITIKDEVAEGNVEIKATSMYGEFSVNTAYLSQEKSVEIATKYISEMLNMFK